MVEEKLSKSFLQKAITKWNITNNTFKTLDIDLKYRKNWEALTKKTCTELHVIIIGFCGPITWDCPIPLHIYPTFVSCTKVPPTRARQAMKTSASLIEGAEKNLRKPIFLSVVRNSSDLSGKQTEKTNIITSWYWKYGWNKNNVVD